MNEWLNPVVEIYLDKFGRSDAPVVWEVGSRDGHDGFELMRRITNGWRAEQKARVVCLEPNPEQAKIIRKNYPQAIVYELAASDRAYEAKFKVYHGNEGDVGSSSLNMKWKDGLDNHIIKVQVVRLEHIMQEAIIDIMKIDVEGKGFQALKGIGDKLNQIKVLHIETENWNKSEQNVRSYLDKRGWILHHSVEQYGGMPDLTYFNANLVDQK